MNKKHSDLFCNIISVIITLVFIALHFYFTLPALNIHYAGFWFTIMLYAGVFMLVGAAVRSINNGNLFGGTFKINGRTGGVEWSVEGGKSGSGNGKMHIFTKIGFGIIGACLAVVFIGFVISLPVFRASTYANVITVTDSDFETDFPETNEVTDIALMDTDSARIIGERALGSLSEVVSQYELSSNYTQINYNDKPKKVSNLEYNGFFKWINNNESGIPGYVMVDPVKNIAEYVTLEKPLKYVPSAYFGEDLERKLRFEYPTKLFESVYFEIDEEGNPFYIISCKAAEAGLFGAMDVTEVIIFNPCDGSSEIYDIGNVPQWVDIVYTGDLACAKYNWYGTLSGGFINSIIGQKGCKQTTDDYGYVMIDDDVWYYTGVTSVIADESNIGFILTNARTGEYKYYPMVGAEEHSAMNAAEGEVQEKGYEASFPCLINVAGEASYIMVLKDDNGLVKQYSLVNVANYNLVANGDTQAEAIAAYKKLLIQNNVISENTEIIEDVPDKNEPEITYTDTEVTVESVKMVVIDGNSYVYIVSDDDKLYKSSVAEDETVLLIEAGMTITLSVSDGTEESVYSFKGWK